MLYLTTRNKFDTYTVHRANQSDRGPDGGLYQPFRLAKVESEMLASLKEHSFGQRVAQILNLFFSVQLTGWDVELCAGKSPVKVVSMGHRMLVAETWHNNDWDFSRLEKNLAARICGYEDREKTPTSWVGIAVRIAVLFGIYGELLASGALDEETAFDISVPVGNFAAPMAAWYARRMGMPIANIICCHDDSSVWDLLHQGQVRTDCGMPENLERLINATLGLEETLRYCEICEKGRMYTVKPEELENLRKGMYATVISPDRLTTLIPSVYRTGGYVFGPRAVLAYGGLQNYRAKTGENRLALLLADRSPVRDSALVASALEISEQELLRQLGE